VDLLIILVASLLLIPLVIFTSGLARIVLGILFVLLFPGYTLIAVLFPRKTDLDSLTRLALSLGISLALVVIILLILNFTPWGIRLYPILISLFLFTGSMAGIAWFRRRRLHPEERFAPAYRINMSKLSRYWANQSKMDKILTGLLVLAVIGVIGTVGFVVARPNVSEKFTEFYILGPQGKAQDYPSELVLDEEGVVIVGIVNNEREAMTYSLGITINGEKVNEISVIRLEQGEKWEQPVTFTPAKVGLDQKVEFLLYKQTPEPYRTLHLWIDVTE
jgi:uncharacterized membrane protein